MEIVFQRPREFELVEANVLQVLADNIDEVKRVAPRFSAVISPDDCAIRVLRVVFCIRILRAKGQNVSDVEIIDPYGIGSTLYHLAHESVDVILEIVDERDTRVWK